MSRISGGSMLRTRRKDVNVKPNRRLDRKSSRGMIYENEELRLRTININAEVERGQSDIKKLRRENEQLRREIWSLREEYDKLDSLLRNGRSNESDNSQSDSEDDSCSEEEAENQECVENVENIQKTKHKGLRVNFDHLSIVSEENTTNSDSTNAQDECSGQPRLNLSSKYDTTTELTSESTTTGDTVLLNGGWDFSCKEQKLLYSEQQSNVQQINKIAIDHAENCNENTLNTSNNPIQQNVPSQTAIQGNQDAANKNVYVRGGPDVFVQNFHNITPTSTQSCKRICSFHTSGNIDNLLKDIETSPNNSHFQPFNVDVSLSEPSNLTRYRSEINVFLQNTPEVGTPPIIPEPMMLLPKLLPYIGFENLTDMPNLSASLENTQIPTPHVACSQNVANGVLPNDAMSAHVRDGTPIMTPICTPEIPKVSIANANEAEQNEQNSEHLKIKTQSPTTRRRLYNANNNLQPITDRKVSMHSDTYHNVRQRLGSISSSSDKNELKTEPIKKSRRVSIYFSGRKKGNNKNSRNKDIPSESSATNDVHKADCRRMSKVKTSDSYRSSKSSRKSKSGHEVSGVHSSMYSTTQESCPEATTSHSERNSVASSRESSTSLSMRSHRSHRKLSASSIHNGNIPWCGCWGNGCL